VGDEIKFGTVHHGRMDSAWGEIVCTNVDKVLQTGTPEAEKFEVGQGKVKVIACRKNGQRM
jgi:uncharacterized Fe-S cluster-containing radical SAM superfamily enzyme